MNALAILQSGAEPMKSAADVGWKLFGAYSLSNPWFLALIPAGVALLLLGRSGRARARFPSLPDTRSPRSLRQRLSWLVPVLQVAALAGIAVALARPLRGSVESSTTSEGVDIALVIDRSDSMRAEDLAQGTSRLDVVKGVVRDFATRRMTDREGAADSIALVVFAMYPQLLCPFTLDVDAVTGFIGGLQIAQNPAENGTAIGSGLAKAVQLLRQSNSKSKVAVLLTDGENNVFHVPPLEAADFAAREKVKVYTIFAGRYAYRPDFLGRPGYSDQEIDTGDLQEIAKRTGGRFFRARDRAELDTAYAEIEKLERTERVTRRWSETFDLYPWFLGPGLALYVLSWLASATWFRRAP
ncbi:MAG: VWA domain-containing protein [Planctomycetota bacterium]|nr:VWA domain-containing protein [Planctomycetota bacterium]